MSIISHASASRQRGLELTAREDDRRQREKASQDQLDQAEKAEKVSLTTSGALIGAQVGGSTAGPMGAAIGAAIGLGASYLF